MNPGARRQERRGYRRGGGRGGAPKVRTPERVCRICRTFSTFVRCVVDEGSNVGNPPKRAFAIIACLAAMARYSAALAIRNWYCSSAIGSICATSVDTSRGASSRRLRAVERAWKPRAMRIGPARTVPRMIRRSTKARRDVPRGRRRRAMRRLVVTTRGQPPATENRQTPDEERKPRDADSS